MNVGNTSSFVFAVLGQFCWYTANGYEVKWSPYPLHTETGETTLENKITFAVVAGKDEEVSTTVKDTLNMVNKVFASLTQDDKAFLVEKLPVQDGEEAKYTVTIKKDKMAMKSTFDKVFDELATIAPTPDDTACLQRTIENLDTERQRTIREPLQRIADSYHIALYFDDNKPCRNHGASARTEIWLGEFDNDEELVAAFTRQRSQVRIPCRPVT